MAIGTGKEWVVLRDFTFWRFNGLDENIRSFYENADYLEISAEYVHQYFELHNENSLMYMTLKSNKGIMKVITNASSYQHLSKAFGALGAFQSVIELNDTYQDYTNQNISGTRATYQITGTVITFLTPTMYAAATGSSAGPGGAVAGVLMGGSFSALELGYDSIAKPIFQQVVTGLSSWESNLKSGRIPW